MDRCRVWESHSEHEPSSGAGRDQDSLGEYDDSQDLGGLRADPQELMVYTGMDSRVPTPVVGVIPRNVETQWKVANGEGQLAPLEAISSLVTRLLRSAQEGQLADEKVPPERGMGSPSAAPPDVRSLETWEGMRPAGGNRRFPQRVKDELTGEGENTRKVLLSVEAEEFSLRTVPKIRVTAEEGSDGRGECIV